MNEARRAFVRAAKALALKDGTWKALARRPDWSYEIRVAVVEVCGNTGCNWFDIA